jgi:hypothetical protein
MLSILMGIDICMLLKDLEFLLILVVPIMDFIMNLMINFSRFRQILRM